MTKQGAQTSVVDDASVRTATREPDPSADRCVLEALLEAGRRASGNPSMTPALLQYWAFLVRAQAHQRARLLQGLRARVRSAETTRRAWLPVALAETDPTLVIDAVGEYLGVPAVSIERRAVAVGEVLDWIRRDLPLNRSAVFAALLGLGDETVLESLAGLRGRLSRVEAADVWILAAGAANEAVEEFLAGWRELLG